MLVPFQGVTPYMPITQGVALGYMIKGFQPTGWYDKYSTVWHHSKCRMNLKLLRFLGS